MTQSARGMENVFSPKVERFILWGLWLVIFVLAVFFREERLFADSSYYLAHTINQGFPQIDHQRFVLAISELLPLIGSYLRLPMSALILLYSVGHVLFAYLIFHHVYIRNNSFGHGLLVLLLQFTGYTYLFFSPMLELWYGLILLVLLDYRLMSGKFTGVWNSFVLSGLALSILFSHPENFIVFLLILAFRKLSGQLPNRWLLIFGLLAIGTAIFKFYTFSDYETGKVTNAQNNADLSQMLVVLEPAYLLKLGKMLLEHYLDCIIGLLLGVWIMYRNKLKMQAMATLLFAIGFIAFINVTLHHNEYGRYTESCYLPLTFIGLFSLSMAWKHIKHPIKPIVWVAVLAVSSIRIWSLIGSDFSKDLQLRNEQMHVFIDEARKNHDRKMILKTENITTEFTRIGWSYPIEALLLSSTEGVEKSVSIIFDEDMEYGDNSKLSTTENFIFRRWELWDYQRLNSHYFQLPDAPYSFSDVVAENPEHQSIEQ